MADRQVTWEAVLRTAKFHRESQQVVRDFERIERAEDRANESSIQGNSDVSASQGRRETSTKSLMQRYMELAKATKAYTQEAVAEAKATDSVTKRQQALTAANEKLADKTTAAEKAARRAASATREYESALASANGVASRDQSNKIERALDRLTEARLKHNRALRDESAASEAVQAAQGALASSGNRLGSILSSVKDGANSASGAVDKMGGALLHLLFTFPAVVTGINVLVSALSSLVAGLGAVAGAVGPAVGALASLPQVLLGGAGVIGTFLSAFSGVGEALKQGVSAEKEAGQAAEDMAEKVSDAAYTVQQAQRAVRDANEAVADALDAQRDAIRSAIDAQDALDRARQQAIYRLQDLKAAVEDEALSEERASLSVEQARQRLAEVMADPAASQLDRRDAELAVKEAEARLAETQKQGKRTRKEYDDARKAGVKGSDEVVQAQRNQVKSLEAVADATRGVRNAQEGLADAQHNLAEALEDLAKAGEDSTGAASKFAEAMSDLSPAAQDFVRLLISLRGEWKKMRDAAAEGLLPGLGRALVTLTQLVPMVSRGLYNFGRIIGGVAEEVADLLVSPLFRSTFAALLKSNEKILRLFGDGLINVLHTLRSIMKAAIPLTEWLAESVVGWTESWRAMTAGEDGQKRLTAFFDRTRETLSVLGRLVGALWTGLVNTFGAGREAGMELLESLTRVTEKWAEWTGSVEGQNRIKAFFDASVGPMKEFGRIIRDVTKAFLRMGENPALEGLLKKLRTELGPAIADVFDKVGTDLAPALIDLATGFAELFSTITPGAVMALQMLTSILISLTDAVTWARENVPGFSQAMVVLLTVLAGAKVAKLLGMVTGLGKLVGIVRFLIPLFEGLGAAAAAASAPFLILAAAIAAAVIAGVILYKKWKPFRDFINGIASDIKNKFVKVWEDDLKPALAELADAWKNAFSSDGKDGGGLIATIKAIWKAYKAYAKFMVTKVWPIMAKFYGFLGGAAVDFLVDLLKGTIRIFTGIIKIVGGVFKVLHGLFTGDWEELWQGVQDITSGAIDVIVGFFMSMIGSVLKLVKNLVDGIVDFFQWLFDVLVGHSIIPDLVKAIVGWFTYLPKQVLKLTKQFMSWLFDAFKSGLNAVGDFVSDRIDDVIDAFESIPDRLKDLGKLFLDAGEFLVGKIFDGLAATGNFVKNFGAAIYDAIADAMNAGFSWLDEHAKISVDTHIPGVGKVDLDLWPGSLQIPKSDSLPGFARGGNVPGYGNRDSVPAMLTPGEFVLKRDAVRRIGTQRLHALNEGARFFARGGSVDPALERQKRRNRNRGIYDGDIQKFHRGGPVLGMKLGMEGKIPTALRWMLGMKNLNAPWDDTLNNRLMRATTQDLRGPAVKPGLVKKLTDYVAGADVKRDVYTKRYVAKRGDTIKKILNANYGDIKDRDLDAFLRTNGYTKTKKTVIKGTPGTPGTAPSGGGTYRPVTGGSAGSIHDEWTGVPAVDIPIPIGTPVRAVDSGRISASYDIRGYEPRNAVQNGYRSYGRVIKVAHPWGTSLYAHLSNRLAQAGNVAAGQEIGKSGSTGYSTGPHLHFGTTGRSPLSFMSGRTGGGGTPGTPGTPDRVISKQVPDYGVLKKSFNLKPGTKLSLPNLVRWIGGRGWSDVKDRFNLSSTEELALLQKALPALNKMGGHRADGLLADYRKQNSPIASAIDALNDRLGLGTKTALNDTPTKDTRKALMHVLAHSFGREHDDLAYRPWLPFTAVEDQLAAQNAANQRQAEFNGFLEKLSGWGLSYLVDDLLEKGVKDGYEIAKSSSQDKNRHLAEQLNESIRKSKLLNQEDMANVLKMVAALSGASAPLGLREVARQLGLSDYNTVLLAEHAREAGRLGTVPATKQAKLWGDIDSFRRGTYYFADGGSVPGTGNQDSVNAMLTPGEFVMTKAAVALLGTDFLHMLNDPRKFARGGLVGDLQLASTPSLSMPSIGSIGATSTGRGGGDTYITYDVDIINPVAEPGTRSMTKMLQRRGAMNGTVRDSDN